MESRARAMGHPIHPIQIPFALGVGLVWLVVRVGVGVSEGANLNAPSTRRMQ